MASLDDTVRLDAEVESMRAAIATRQRAYASSHRGRFWQGVRTHSAIPTVASPADRLSIKAGGHDVAWGETALVSSAAYEVHTYDGPMGCGYVLYATTRSADGTLWRCAIAAGPEDGRACTWSEVRR